MVCGSGVGSLCCRLRAGHVAALLGLRLGLHSQPEKLWRVTAAGCIHPVASGAYLGNDSRTGFCSRDTMPPAGPGYRLRGGAHLTVLLSQCVAFVPLHRHACLHSAGEFAALARASAL